MAGRPDPFFVSGHDQLEDQLAYPSTQAFSNGPITVRRAPQGYLRTLVAGSVTHQLRVNDDNLDSARTLSMRASRIGASARTTLGRRPVSISSTGRKQVTYHATKKTVIHPTLLGQNFMCCSATMGREPTSQRCRRRAALLVAGAFTGGGALADLLRTLKRTFRCRPASRGLGARHRIQDRIPAAQTGGRRGFLRPDESRRHFLLRRADPVSRSADPIPFVQPAKETDDVAFLEKAGWRLRQG
jgi:hypothetical protein